MNDRTVVLVGMLLISLLALFFLSFVLTGLVAGDDDLSPPELLTKTPPSCGTYPPTPCPYWTPTAPKGEVYVPLALDWYPAPGE